MDKVKLLAARRESTPAQLALAWVPAQGDDIFPIPGTKRCIYLEENVRAADLQLSWDELAELGAIFPVGVAAGTWCQESGMKLLNG